MRQKFSRRDTTYCV